MPHFTLTSTLPASCGGVIASIAPALALVALREGMPSKVTTQRPLRLLPNTRTLSPPAARPELLDRLVMARPPRLAGSVAVTDVNPVAMPRTFNVPLPSVPMVTLPGMSATEEFVVVIGMSSGAAGAGSSFRLMLEVAPRATERPFRSKARAPGSYVDASI